MCVLLLAAALSLQSSADVRIEIDAAQAMARPNPAMIGIFFEEINQAGEGGIYPELLRNRGFEGADSHPQGWRAVATSDAGKAETKAGDVLNDSRSRSLELVRTQPGGRVEWVNEGFWGIPIHKGRALRLVIWSKGTTPLSVSLQKAGQTFAESEVPTSAEWKRHEIRLLPTGSASNAELSLGLRQPGRATIGYASLMPTDNSQGLRRDLAAHIRTLRPGFVRFPGGCFVEGETLPIRWNWKDSLGPIETRRGMARSQWGYPISNGLGYHEYLQWCEDLGAEPLFVANVGMSHREVAPMDQMDGYLQDTLDAIEYANGPVTSPWGARREKAGHPKPFHLKYIEIGNENGGAAYDERYALFAKAIKERHPEIVRIANLWGGGLPTSAPFELIDEHYYSTPAWFWRNANRYDRYRRSGPKIYVGEYAVTRGSGRGNVAAALGEAAFMTGMERNADVVRLASYAPLFENVNNRQWNPNAILFDNTRSYGTPSYWVQSLFATNLPTRVVRHVVKAASATPPTVSGNVGLMTWRTAAEFKDVEFMIDGKRVFSSANLRPEAMQILDGNWVLDSGVVRQTREAENLRVWLKDAQVKPGQKVTLSLRARKLSGYEGFIIQLGASDGGSFQWNLGGWGNTVHAFQRDDERTGPGVPGSIETGRWYDIRLEREGSVTRGFLDGKLIEEITESGTPDFAAVCGIDETSRTLIIKAVNGSSRPRPMTLDVRGLRLGDKGTMTVLAGQSLSQENSFDHPKQVAPQVRTIHQVKPQMVVTIPPFSFDILRIPIQK
jgi:alpha-L-arabinofuranosidase